MRLIQAKYIVILCSFFFIKIKLIVLLLLFQLVCIIVDNESDVAAFKDFKDDSPAPSPAAAAAPSPPPPAPTPPPLAPKPVAAAAPAPAPAPTVKKAHQGGGRIYASPLARRLAAEKNLDLEVSIKKNLLLTQNTIKIFEPIVNSSFY